MAISASIASAREAIEIFMMDGRLVLGETEGRE
jgi:hypothetical protein